MVRGLFQILMMFGRFELILELATSIAVTFNAYEWMASDLEIYICGLQLDKTLENYSYSKTPSEIMWKSVMDGRAETDGKFTIRIS